LGKKRNYDIGYVFDIENVTKLSVVTVGPDEEIMGVIG